MYFFGPYLRPEHNRYFSYHFTLTGATIYVANLIISLFVANGRFSHSGSQMIKDVGLLMALKKNVNKGDVELTLSQCLCLVL